MTHARLLALRRMLGEHRAGLLTADPWPLLEEALDELEPLHTLWEAIEGPISELKYAVRNYDRS